MGKAYALVTVRDRNALCQHYNTCAQIESQTRRRKITRAHRRKGVLEVRTAARDEWVQPVAWSEWVNAQSRRKDCLCGYPTHSMRRAST